MGRHKVGVNIEKLASVAHLFGTMSDRKIAPMIGVSGSTIAYHRLAAGIPSTRTTAREWHTKLGTVPDGEIAEEFGISRQAVSKMRGKLGIARFDDGSRPAPHEPEAPKPPSVRDEVLADVRAHPGTSAAAVCDRLPHRHKTGVIRVLPQLVREGVLHAELGNTAGVRRKRLLAYTVAPSDDTTTTPEAPTP